MQIDLTTLTLRITEDSAKQLMITLLFTGISMIRLIGYGNVFYVSPAHFAQVSIPSMVLTSRNVQAKHNIHSHLQAALILLISILS